MSGKITIGEKFHEVGFDGDEGAIWEIIEVKDTSVVLEDVETGETKTEGRVTLVSSGQYFHEDSLPSS